MSSTDVAVFTGTDQIERFVNALAEPAWSMNVRRQALEKFNAMPWPTTEDEEWRRSDVSSYDFDRYALSPVEASIPAAGAVPEGRSGLLRFENGRCVAASLAPELAEKGVVFASLAAFLHDETANHAGNGAKAHAAVQGLFERRASEIEHRLFAWHYATWTHGVVLYVPGFVEVEQPFEVQFHCDGDAVLATPHVVAVAETGGRATLLHTVSSDDEGEILLNEVINADVADTARLEIATHYELNYDSSAFSNGHAVVGRDAAYHSFVSSFGGMFSKLRMDAELNGTGGDIDLDGLYFAGEDQHMDLRTLQVHNAVNANSRTFYKGAVKDEAHTIYQGLIRVAHGASKTDAYLTNNNLVLNNGARADSIPGLNINTDDVKCSHGSTTGKIDEVQLYYLQTRGFDYETARIMLVQGFLEEVIAKAPDAVQDRLRELVEQRILAEYDTGDDE